MALRLGAHGLATTWERLGPNSWGGLTDLAIERAYQTTGLSLFAFGLVLLTLAFCRWLFAGTLPFRPEERHAPR